MADPVTLAILGGASGGLQAFGAVSEGNAAKAAADYNARQAEEAAMLTRAQGAENERRVRAIARKQIGETQANIGASGLSFDGSALDILGESAANAELDALNTRYDAESKAAAYRNSASLQRMQGKMAQTSGYIRGASAVLSSASSMGKGK